MQGRRLLAITGAFLALALGACGGDDESGGGASTNEEGPSTRTEHAKTSTAPEVDTGVPAQTLTIAETEFKLDPAKLTAGKGTVRLDVQNNGQIVHALELEGPKGEVETGSIQPGKSKKLEVRLDKPGTYEMYCPIDNHKAQGMKGRITVGG